MRLGTCSWDPQDFIAWIMFGWQLLGERKKMFSHKKVQDGWVTGAHDPFSHVEVS